MRKPILFISMLLFCLLSQVANAEKLSEILSNAEDRVGEEVEVDGLITQLEEAKNPNFRDYWLKDRYGDIIMVHTDGKQPPTTNLKYKVKGYLTYNKDDGRYFISETGRTKLNDDAFVMVDTPTLHPPVELAAESKPWWIENFLIIAIVGGAVIILLVFMAFSSSKKKSGSNKEKPSFTSQMDHGTKKEPITQVIFDNTEDLKTMIIPKADPKTMKFIPGKLEVVKGGDVGKVFKIAGTPQKDGSSIVTIGREPSTESNMFSHIQLKEHTISRKQAQIIQSNGNIKIKNLSSTNYTKVDGKELLPDETMEMGPGVILTFGEVDIKYSN